MTRRTADLVLALTIVLLTLAQPQPGDAKSPPPVLDGADLPHPVTLAIADWQALTSARPQPARLAAPPAVTGAVYRLTNWAWVDIQPWTEEQQAASAAQYYPAGGYLEAVGQTETAWFQLDAGRQRLLDRYLRLARSGSLPAEPSNIQVLAGAAAEEVITLSVGWGNREVPLPAAVTEAFWQAAAAAAGRSISRPQPLLTGVEVGFELRAQLPEGWVVTFWYDRARELFVDAIGIEQGWSQLTGFTLDGGVTRAVVDVATTAGVAFPERTLNRAEPALPAPTATAAAEARPTRGVSWGALLAVAGTLVVSLAVLRHIGRRMRAGRSSC